MQSSRESWAVTLARCRRHSKTGYWEHKEAFLPQRKTSPERHTGGQILQVSWIEELGHVQTQFAAGFQEHAHIILQIQVTQRRHFVGLLCSLGSED